MERLPHRWRSRGAVIQAVIGAGFTHIKYVAMLPNKSYNVYIRVQEAASGQRKPRGIGYADI